MRRGMILLIVLLVPSLVLAGTISLTTSVTTDVFTSESGEVQVTLRNSGDEAAYNVQLSVISDYFSSSPINVGTLGVDSPFETNVSLVANSELKEGNYPIVLMIEYTDANGYPFSSVSPKTLTYMNPYSSRITGVFENIEVNGKKGENLVLELKNMDQTSHDVNIRLILPNELSSDVTEKNVSMDSKEEKDVVFKISNFAGLEGSNYVVLALIQYEDGYHYSSTTSGMVKIVQGKNIFKPSRTAIFAVVGFLILVFILYQFKSKKFELKFEKKKEITKENKETKNKKK